MKISPARAIGAGLALVLAGCANQALVRGAPSVERMYVIECGESHAKDLSFWTTPADSGKPYIFSNNCYLIRHAKGWMLWDSGNPDRFAGLPNGQANPGGP